METVLIGSAVFVALYWFFTEANW